MEDLDGENDDKPLDFVVLDFQTTLSSLLWTTFLWPEAYNYCNPVFARMGGCFRSRRGAGIIFFAVRSEGLLKTKQLSENQTSDRSICIGTCQWYPVIRLTLEPPWILENDFLAGCSYLSSSTHDWLSKSFEQSHSSSMAENEPAHQPFCPDWPIICQLWLPISSPWWRNPKINSRSGFFRGVTGA